MARNDQLVRQWRVLEALIASRLGRTWAELREDVFPIEANERTIRRDVEALEAAGFPMERVRGPDGVRMRCEARFRQAPMPALTVMEVLALWFAREVLRAIARTPVHSALAGLLARIEREVPGPTLALFERLARRFYVKTLPEAPGEPGTLGAVVRAIEMGRVVEAVYRSLESGKVRTVRLGPLSIVHAPGGFYLIGVLMEDRMRSMRTLKLQRIERVTVTDEAFEPHASFDAKAYLAGSVGIHSTGKVEEYRVRTWRVGARLLGERPLHASQGSRRKGSNWIFTWRLGDHHELQRMLLSMGAEVEVLAPAWFRDEMKAGLGLALRRYEGRRGRERGRGRPRARRIGSGSGSR